jgi:hypothetical protein
MNAGSVRTAALALACLAGCAPVPLPTAGVGEAPALTSFGFLSPPVSGTIAENDRTVTVEVPAGTGLSALVAVFTVSGERVLVGGTEQESGRTPNDFSGAVEYVVEGTDATRVTYVVRVTTLPSPGQEKAITDFSIVSPQVSAAIDEIGHSITGVVPHGTDRSSLVAEYVTTGVTVTVDDTEQQSGVTINDFTEPLTYVVTAEDGSTRSYTVEMEEAPSGEKSITSFSIRAPGAAAVIDETQRIVRCRVADGTVRSSLVADFSTTGACVRVGGVVQQSGVTANDFSNAVEYEVAAEDGSIALYTVRVTGRIALLVNELDVDQVGVDNAEFMELLALETVDLWGIVVILINGGVTPGLEYARIDLSTLGELSSGSSLLIAGPLVTAAAGAVKYTPPGWTSSNRIQNGPSDAVMIWDTIGRKVVDTVTYAGVLHRALISGETGELDATEGSTGASADSNTVIGSLARSPNGQDTGQNGTDFKFSPVMTPGGPNP